MKNIKKVTSIVLAFILTVSLQVQAVKAETIQASVSDPKICETLGMLIGEGNGLTTEYLAQTPNRIQAALLYLRLKGLDQEAMKYSGTSNFDDADKEKWASNVMAYLKANPDLGMVGVGDNKFSPDTPITAQGYYKILLEALGYKSGVDFMWENTISFAASKGMSKVAGVSKFTISDLATATVEALRVSVKGKVDTLAGSLVKAGKFNAQQSEFLKSSGISLVSVDFTASVSSASCILLKFDKEIADITKITFSVTKNAQPSSSIIGEWNAGKTELLLTSNTKFDVGSYTVTVTYDNSIIGTKTVNIEDERIESIKLVPGIAVLISDIKGEVGYKAYNQYGEDISNSQIMQNVHWSTTADSITADIKNTKLIITKNGTDSNSQLKDTKNIYITGYNENWKPVVAQQVEVSDGFGLVKDIKFLGIYNENGKTEITVDTLEKFYIEYEAYDVDGNKLDNYNLLNNIANLGVNSSNPSISAHVVRDPDNMSKALIEIDTHTSSGTSVITGVALATGKSTSIQVEVKKGAVLSDFIVEIPVSGFPVNERVEIPYKAYDQNGNQLYGFDEINGKIVFVASDPINALIVGERAQDGKYILTGRFTEVKNYQLKVIILESNKANDFTIKTNPAAQPTTLASINRDIVYNAIVEKGQIRVDFVNNPGFTVLDQNNNEFNMKDNNYLKPHYYYINAVSSDNQKVGFYGNASMAYKSNEIVLLGGSSKGAATITFELCRDTDLNPGNGKEVLDVKEVVIYNIDKKEITQYEFSPIPTLYANPDVAQTDSYAAVSKQKQQYASEIRVFGKMASGYKVALSPAIGVGNNILNLTVTDSSRFSVDLSARKILAKTSGTDNEVADKLTATIEGANGVISTISTDVKSTKAIPVAQEIYATLKNDSQIVRTGDSFTCTATVFNSVISGRELRRYDSAGNDTVNADITFVIKDQYGNTALTPSYFAITTTQGTGIVKVNPTTGLVSGLASSGNQLVITAVTNNGLTKAITLNIQ